MDTSEYKISQSLSASGAWVTKINGPTALLTCERWDRFCHRLFHAYQDAAMDLVDRHE